jgi:hypothetical protein
MTMSDCEDVATVPFSLRLAAKELAEIGAEAKRLGMSANSYFRYGAKLAREVNNDRELVRQAAARCRREARR